MFNHLMICSILGTSLLSTSAAVCKADQEATSSKNKMQDSAKAVEFFENELDFTTVPYGVNKAVEEKAKDITIVDVRSADEFAKGHVPGAVNLPYDKYNGFAGVETDFPGLRKDGYNIVYCYELLCNLAKKAAKKFASLGYPVKEMVGGFEDWKKAAYPIEK